MNDKSFQKELLKTIDFFQKQKINPSIKDLEHLTDRVITLSSLSSLILEIQINSYQQYLNKSPNDAFGWYQFSEFLRYKTNFLERSIEAAQRSVEICRLNLSPVGAISRNFLSLAFSSKKFKFLEEEFIFLCSEKFYPNHIVNDLKKSEIESYTKFLSVRVVDLIEKVRKNPLD